MTNLDVISPHPADELLAAYADGRLDGRKAEEVFVHLDSCDDCRAIWDALADARDEGVIERADAPVVVRGNFGWKVAIGTLATAAAATAIFYSPPVQERLEFQRTGGVSALIAVSHEVEERDVDGRLTGFPHKTLNEPERSGESNADLDVAILLAAAQVQKSAGETPTSAKDLRALGLAYLLTGERTNAIETLELANKAADGKDPVVLNDLAAAYLEESTWTDNRLAAVAAFGYADAAWKLGKSPEAAWNRALALEQQDKDAEARAAWSEYLALDPSSPWAQEVREKHLPDSLLD